MMSNNKVLTVSYGTFSCTLEGFEDSFGAMKAVAEYFRDLAADDRYFGAEPPQPDAEMIAQIAARQSARQVEGRRDGDGYVLRAHEATGGVLSDAPAQTGDPAPALAESAPQAEVMEPEDPEENLFDAAALQGGDDFVSDHAPFATAQADRSEDNIFSDMDAEDDDVILSAALTDAEVDEIYDEDFDEEGAPELTMASFAPQMTFPDPDIVPQPESITAKLQRIRAVVSSDAVVAGTTYDEDEHAEVSDSGLTVETAETAVEDEPGRTSDEARIASVLANFAIADDDTDALQAPPEGPLVLGAENAVQQVAAIEAAESAPETGMVSDRAAEELSAFHADSGDMQPAVSQKVSNDPAISAVTANMGAFRLANTASIAENDLDRLMAEADNQMDEPEGSDRRATFSQLRAAVAATNADGDKDANTTEEDSALYRDDLEQAVKPRRPIARGTRTERPAAQPTPLQLVAEQRVDMSEAAKEPVQPRRVLPEPASTVDEASDFEAYAAERGATELPALLEAAASYLSFVEGMPQFSRPQLMSKVRQVKKEEFNREHGLRSFGQLLRIGKIEKIKGGRFTVSDDIGYRPEDQRAVG